LPPHTCAVTGRNEGPFVDTLSSIPIPAPRIYLSFRAIREAGELIGMGTPERVAELESQLQAAQDENAALTAKNVELKGFMDSVEVLRRSNFKTERKRGPKPKEKASA
jgi:hypothetical protein